MTFCLAVISVCTAHASTFCLTISGLGGEPDYEQRFASLAQEIDKTLKAAGGDVKLETLHGPRATKAQLQTTLQEFGRQAKAADSLVVMMIGHGTFDGSEYKINLPGPDLSAVELSSMLDRMPASRQLVVNMTSASGASVHALQKENRTVITATKSGTEKNATVFARYWVEALRDAAADADKNEVISALEAFRYAEQKTKTFYESQKRLATEHSQVDGGEEQGTLNAGRFALLRLGTIQLAAQDPAKQALLARREELEQQIERLKFQKAAIPLADYRKQLSVLLLDLAKTQAEVEK